MTMSQAHPGPRFEVCPRKLYSRGLKARQLLSHCLMTFWAPRNLCFTIRGHTRLHGPCDPGNPPRAAEEIPWFGRSMSRGGPTGGPGPARSGTGQSLGCRAELRLARSVTASVCGRPDRWWAPSFAGLIGCGFSLGTAGSAAGQIDSLRTTGSVVGLIDGPAKRGQVRWVGRSPPRPSEPDRRNTDREGQAGKSPRRPKRGEASRSAGRRQSWSECRSHAIDMKALSLCITPFPGRPGVSP